MTAGTRTRTCSPKENDKRIDVLSSGEVRTFQNTACVTPNAPVAGYTAPPGSVEIPAVTAVGTGKVFHQVLDESAVKGHTYRVEFWDIVERRYGQ